MRVMLDTNILISLIVFKSKPMQYIIDWIADGRSLVLCSYIIDELHDVIDEKFPNKKAELEKFLTEMPFEFFYTPRTLPKHDLFEIRDKDDEWILYSAILSEVDVLVTGDKDLLVIDSIERLDVISHLDFPNKY